MAERTVEIILAEWRAAEAALDGDAPDNALAARIASMRGEHAAAVKAREDEARELARHARVQPGPAEPA